MPRCIDCKWCAEVNTELLHYFLKDAIKEWEDEDPDYAKQLKNVCYICTSPRMLEDTLEGCGDGAWIIKGEFTIMTEDSAIQDEECADFKRKEER